tara:strand:+ start:98 stop:691 length:594 start_codon:yes stop_codon:yes gene_type:complete
MEDFILTSTEFSKLINISTESLRSRRRRGMYADQYVLKNKSYWWKKPRPKQVAMTAFDRCSVSRDSRSQLHGPRNKNSGNHKLGVVKNYPNKAFEIHNEIRMLAKAKKKISAAGAEEITEDVIEIARQKHQEKLLKRIEPVNSGPPLVTTSGYTRSYLQNMNPFQKGNYTRLKYKDEIEDEDREFWSSKNNKKFEYY